MCQVFLALGFNIVVVLLAATGVFNPPRCDAQCQAEFELLFHEITEYASRMEEQQALAAHLVLPVVRDRAQAESDRLQFIIQELTSREQEAIAKTMQAMEPLVEKLDELVLAFRQQLAQRTSEASEAYSTEPLRHVSDAPTTQPCATNLTTYLPRNGVYWRS